MKKAAPIREPLFCWVLRVRYCTTTRPTCVDSGVETCTM